MQIKTIVFHKKFLASGQKNGGVPGREIFAREPSGFSCLPSASGRQLSGQVRFLDLWIKFGKIISKVCSGFNSGAKFDNTNLNLAPGGGFEPPTHGLTGRCSTPELSRNFLLL